VRDNQARIDVLGIGIDNLTMDGVLARIDDIIRAGKPSVIYTANSNHVRLFRADPVFAKAYKEADLVTADGVPVMLAAKIFGTPIAAKVSGSDLTEKICALSAKCGYRIYFLGAAEGVGEQAKGRCEKMYPGVQIVGVYSPSRAELTDEAANKAIIEKINSSGANILYAALNAPFQEIWLSRARASLRVPVLIGVGGSIDYLAGLIKRPPAWVCRAGFEWLARLIQSPRRYWKRYLSDSVIIWYILSEALRRRRQRSQ